MKVVKDTLKLTDANEFGEILREYCFPGEGYGCYSNFALRPEFIRCRPTEDILTKVLGEGWRENEYAQGDDKRVHYYSNGDVEVAWFWDGDGTLFFKEGPKQAINTDCKKDYTWEWV